MRYPLPVLGTSPDRLSAAAGATAAPLLALSLLVGGLAGQASPAQPGVLAPVAAEAERVARAIGVDAAGCAMVRADRVVHVSTYGALAADTAMPIADASRWLTVATILTLVADGTLELDLPLARYVEEFERDDKRRVTLRQCLDGTGGLPDQLGERMRRWDMDKFAREASREALRSLPNSAFVYSDVGLQLAAVAAERATGRSWHELFAARIAKPLRLTATRFGTFEPLGGDPGTAALPWVAAGAVASLDDYARFVQLLLADGRLGDRQLLPRELVHEMFRDQVRSQIDVRDSSLLMHDARYGLGTWIEPLTDGGVRVSAPGARGFTPWLDLDLGVGCVFAVEDRAQRVLRHLPRLREVVRDAARSAAVVGADDTIQLRHKGRDRRYHLHLPAGVDTLGDLPLLVALHGEGRDGEAMRRATGLADFAGRNGFVVAFPDGTGRLAGSLSWNAGDIDVYAAHKRVDDVGFLKAMVRDIQLRTAIDARRVYVVGFDNGGAMCHRLARQAADVFAGVAVVGGVMLQDLDADDAGSPIAALLVHSDDDARFAVAGGQLRRGSHRVGYPGLRRVTDYYVTRNNVQAYPDVEAADGVEVTEYGTSSADAPVMPVRVVRLARGGHAWPGGSDVAADWSATREVVRFFRELGEAADEPAAVPSVPR